MILKVVYVSNGSQVSPRSVSPEQAALLALSGLFGTERSGAPVSERALPAPCVYASAGYSFTFQHRHGAPGRPHTTLNKNLLEKDFPYKPNVTFPLDRKVPLCGHKKLAPAS